MFTKFESSKLNVLLRVLRANLLFNRPVTTQRLSKVINETYCLA